MKVQQISSLLLVFINIIECSIVGRAISEVITNFYIKYDHKFDIVCYQCESFEAISLLSTVARKIQQTENIPLRVMKRPSDSFWNCFLRTSSIILFDSLDTYSQFLVNVTWKPQFTSNRPNHLLYVKGLTKDEFTKLNGGHSLNVDINELTVFRDYVGNLSSLMRNKDDGSYFIRGPERILLEQNYLNINYIIEVNSTSLDLMTLRPFTKSHCQVSQPTVINHFSEQTGKWLSDNFFPRKGSNLHNCRLNYESDPFKPGLFYAEDRLSGTIRLSGYTYEIHEAIAKHLNIKAFYVQQPSSLETVARLHLVFNPDPKSLFPQLESFLFDIQPGFFIPPGQPYSQFEKMFMMFDEDVWIAIAVTLFGGFVILQALNTYFSRSTQDLVFGKKVRTTNMNYIGVIVGTGQTVLPEGNFARFILMMFIILCLVLRTCHQSMLYFLLQSDLRRPVMKTIEEAIARNYTFYIMEFSTDAEYLERLAQLI